ncbi:MAG: S8 family serine peptidase, partial [Calditrichota bacterium]
MRRFTTPLQFYRVRCLISAIAILFMFSPVLSYGGNSPRDDEIRPGVLRVKLSVPIVTALPDGGAKRWGVPPLDRFLNDIKATWVERTFPYCLPPQPQGIDLTRTYNVYFPESLDVQSVCRDLAKIDGVEYAEPWTVAHLDLDHNDPDRNRQYYLDLLDVNEAQEFETGDPEVVIGLSDNGTDLDHEDLAGSIWVNPGEDLNDNGVVDDEDRNNRDDDGNGRIDDFYGWDFARNDNDPNDDVNHGHGTHTAGLIAAMTNNRIGIASIAFNCKIMVARCGSGDRITAGPESIEYAATNGAKVINCSWGGPRGDQTLNDAVDYAFEQDALVVCAAGNRGSAARHYPAAYENAVAVAATDRNDQRAGFSSYGDWVDVAAPGVGVYSTLPNNRYGDMDGTSMASPIAASVAALIRSAFPDFNNVATRMYLLVGVDELQDLRLGSGRVNALRALRASDYPIIQLNGFNITQDGNGNGELDPDERASLAVTVSNLGQAAEEITAFMTTDD